MVFRRLASRRFFPGLPVVMFTSFETVRLSGEAMEAGVTSVFSKLEPVRNLVRAIQSLFDFLS